MTSGNAEQSLTIRRAEVSKPETAREALELWDRGESVFTAEMGGLGPGYEQVIHIMAFELVRELLKHEPIDWAKADEAQRIEDYSERRRSEWGRFAQQIEDAVMPRVSGLGSSGAQWGAAQSVAYRTMRKGWSAALAELPDDRLIQVSKNWPRLPAAVTA